MNRHHIGCAPTNDPTSPMLIEQNLVLLLREEQGITSQPVSQTTRKGGVVFLPIFTSFSLSDPSVCLHQILGSWFSVLVIEVLPFWDERLLQLSKSFFFFLKSHLDITSSLLFMFWAFSTPINPLILDCARTQRPLSGLLLFYLTFFLDMPWLHFACLGDRWSVDPPLLHLLSIAFSESSPPAGRNTNKSDQMLWSRISNKNHWTEIFWKEADIKWKLLSRLRNTEKMCGKYDSSLGGTGNISDLERV